MYYTFKAELKVEECLHHGAGMMKAQSRHCASLVQEIVQAPVLKGMNTNKSNCAKLSYVIHPSLLFSLLHLNQHLSSDINMRFKHQVVFYILCLFSITRAKNKTETKTENKRLWFDKIKKQLLLKEEELKNSSDERRFTGNIAYTGESEIILTRSCTKCSYILHWNEYSNHKADIISYLLYDQRFRWIWLLVFFLWWQRKRSWSTSWWLW